MTQVLSLKDGCEELAQYLAACLRLADRACSVLSAEGEPLLAEQLANRLYASPDALLDVLHYDYRFRVGDDGDASLLVWDRMAEARKSPVSALAYRSLYWRGLPQSISALADEINEYRGGSLKERALAAPLERSTDFVERGGKWTLREWFEPRLQFEPSYALLEKQRSPGNSTTPADLLPVVIGVLRDLKSVVPFEWLWWELGMRSTTELSKPDELSLERMLFEDRTVTWLRNGQLAASSWLSEATEWIDDLSPSDRSRLRKQLLGCCHDHMRDSDQLSQWLAKAKLRSTQDALRYLHSMSPAAAPPAKVFEYALAPKEIEAQLGRVDPALAESEYGKALVSRLMSEAEDDLRQSLIREGVFALANGDLMLVPAQRAQRLAGYFNTTVTGKSSNELIRHLWPEHAPVGIDVTRISDYLTELGLEFSDGCWHAAGRVLSELVWPVAQGIRDTLVEANGPQDLETLMTRSGEVPPDCPQPVRRIAHETVAGYLARSDRTWHLECGKWWCQPKEIATPARLGQLRSSGTARYGVGLLSALTNELGLALEELIEDEVQAVLRAFAQTHRAPPLMPAPSPTPTAPKRERPAPPENLGWVPPQHSAVTLDAEMLRLRSLKLPRGARRIFQSCLEHVETDTRRHVLVEGIFRIDVELDLERKRLRSDGLFKWLDQQGAAPGDRVVIYAPAPGASAPHVSHEARLQAEEAGASGGHVRLHLRERIVGVLEETGCVLQVDDIAREINMEKGVVAEKPSIAGALSSNTHLFAQWGSGLWGMREWGGDWTDRVPLHLLAWRIEEESLVVSILENEGRAMTVAELAADIAAQFAVRVEAVRKVSFVRRTDPLIYWPEGSDRVMLRSWFAPDLDLIGSCWQYLLGHPAAMSRVTRWFAELYERPLEAAVRELGLGLEMEER